MRKDERKDRRSRQRDRSFQARSTQHVYISTDAGIVIVSLDDSEETVLTGKQWSQMISKSLESKVE